MVESPADLVQSVRTSARDFLTRELPASRLRSLLDSQGEQSQLWSRVGDLGWFQLELGNAANDDGLGVAAASAIFEESGRFLFPGPLFDTMVVGSLLRARVPDINPAEPVAFASMEHGSRGLPAYAETRLQGLRVSGRKVLVQFADRVQWLVVLAADDAGPVLVAVKPSDGGFLITPRTGPDLVSRPCEVVMTSVPVVSVLADGDEAVAILSEVTTLANALHAARSVGIMRAALELAIQYAKDRQQFGRPIGSFQAVQHRLADAAVLVETAAACCRRAEREIASRSALAESAARVAKAFTANNARVVVESALQVHGGIGFTEEYPLHLYIKHAVGTQGLWGDGGLHADELGKARLSQRDSSRST